MFVRKGDGFEWANSPEANKLYRVDGTGAACLLIHRSALEMVKSDWFSTVGDLGEDLSFCRRLADHDIPVYVHTGIKASHHKSVWL